MEYPTEVQHSEHTKAGPPSGGPAFVLYIERLIPTRQREEVLVMTDIDLASMVVANVAEAFVLAALVTFLVLALASTYLNRRL